MINILARRHGPYFNIKVIEKPATYVSLEDYADLRLRFINDKGHHKTAYFQFDTLYPTPASLDIDLLASAVHTSLWKLIKSHEFIKHFGKCMLAADEPKAKPQAIRLRETLARLVKNLNRSSTIKSSVPLAAHANQYGTPAPVPEGAFYPKDARVHVITEVQLPRGTSIRCIPYRLLSCMEQPKIPQKGNIKLFGTHCAFFIWSSFAFDMPELTPEDWQNEFMQAAKASFPMIDFTGAQLEFFPPQPETNNNQEQKEPA